MIPQNPRLPGILIELKAAKNCTEQQLEALAQTALKQIGSRDYCAELRTMKVPVIKIGLAFSGKKARIAAERE